MASGQAVSFVQDGGKIDIRVGDQAFAKYVWEDGEIPRPYFCQVHAPNGAQVTRFHPPDPVRDKKNDDHPTYHPGAWLAFGDFGDADFWRNKGHVRHLRFAGEPQGGEGVGRFTVVNAYETREMPPRIVCEETCTYMVRVLPEGWLLSSESEFSTSHSEVAFGDQEEMGFGARLATPLTVKHGTGAIWNSAGGRNEDGTWGREARWCAAAGTIDKQLIGLAVLVSPDNFRPSWFHTRDYGLIVANPFGKKAMTAPDDDSVAPDSTPVPSQAELLLGFGLFVFAAAQDAPPDLEVVWERYRQTLHAPK